eukprot:3547542-Amphidinium_carterae.1
MCLPHTNAYLPNFSQTKQQQSKQSDGIGRVSGVPDFFSPSTAPWLVGVWGLPNMLPLVALLAFDMRGRVAA